MTPSHLKIKLCISLTHQGFISTKAARLHWFAWLFCYWGWWSNLPSHFQGVKDLDLSNEISCTSFQATLITDDKAWQPGSDSFFSKQQDSVFNAETSLMKNCSIFFFAIQMRKDCGLFSALGYFGLSAKTLLWDLLSFLQRRQAEKASVCRVGRQDNFSLSLSKSGVVSYKVDKVSEKSWSK